MARSQTSEFWYLEGYIGDDRIPHRYSINVLPYRVGRRGEAELCLPPKDVSGLHAEIHWHAGHLWLRDLDSLNGTFVNRRRVLEPVPLSEGDIIHFSRTEFIVGRAKVDSDDTQDPTIHNAVSPAALPERIAAGTGKLREMLALRAVIPFFQPIVELDGQRIFSYEVLGRGRFDPLPRAPYELFRIAEAIGQEPALSDLFRWEGVYTGSQLPGPPPLFVNTHPTELLGVELIASLRRLRAQFPEQVLAMEIHEATVSDGAAMAELKDALTELDITLAYDDFGAGQARLLELVEVPPDYLKFDMSLIRGIHTASAAKRNLVQTLVAMVRDMGIACVAEGIECQRELEFCRRAGFHFGQGYYLGRPAPAQTWATAPPGSLCTPSGTAESNGCLQTIRAFAGPS